jgi:ketosteroid isomerase-like protein
MSREQTKTAVIETLQAMAEGRWNDGEYILRHTTNDFEWWVARSTAVSGTNSRAELLEMYKMMPSITDGGITITPTSWVIDGDRAAFEAVSYMKLKDGREYRNEYHYAVEMRDGKIRRLKEYMDTSLPDKYFLPG